MLGLLTLTALALTWLSVALGLQAKTAETASNTPMFLLLLPFLGSSFVPPAPCRLASAGSPNTSRSRWLPRPCARC
ncbi:MAG: hypothetical protein WAK71_20925 [Streptosporangiaceae bacterium]